MEGVKVFLFRFKSLPDRDIYEIELRRDGFTSRGSITGTMYEELRGHLKEEEFSQGFFVCLDPSDEKWKDPK